MNHHYRPRISLGLPVYNGKMYLREALDSILSQSYPHFELIISDNGSDDNTQSICEEYRTKDTRVGITRTRNQVSEKNPNSGNNHFTHFPGAAGIHGLLPL